MLEIIIPCLHESGKIKNWREKHPDYYPLTKDEIGTLLSLAKKADNSKSKNIRLVSQIQVRLIQGINGMVCPRPYEDKEGVGNREAELSELYIRWLKHKQKVTPALVKKLFKIMNPS